MLLLEAIAQSIATGLPAAQVQVAAADSHCPPGPHRHAAQVLPHKQCYSQPLCLLTGLVLKGIAQGCSN